MRKFRGKSGAVRLPALLALLAAGCGDIVDMGRHRDLNPRRVYVNDVAANDSLPATLSGEGLLFVMQPGKQYALRMKTPAAGDSLAFFTRGAGGGNYVPHQTLGSTALPGGFRSFPLQPTKSAADYYLVFLRGPGGSRASPPDSVRLATADTAQSAAVAVRLLMVRQLHGLPDADAKAAYARAFHAELRNIYAAYGVTVDTSTVLVEPAAPPLTVNFASDFVQIPGDPHRHPGGINLYLVDSIRAGSSPGMVLGFAPREAPDLASHPESRVVLNVRGGGPLSMAVTAAHEMGHFLGLRHTSATVIDRGFDKDESNRDDGFASTPFCGILEKGAADGATALEVTVESPGGRAYCLRVAGVLATCACPDAGNLMYPYQCSPSTQKALGLDQRTFLRRNLRMYQ